MYSFKFKFYLFIFAFFMLPFLTIAELQAYQPGKWSPMDVYIESGKKDGPKRLVLKDATGKILESSEFVYDESGHLTEEKYYSAEGNYTGKIEYTYALGNIAQEILKAKDGKIISTKEFRIRPNTMEIVVLNPEGVTLIRHMIRHNKMKVTGGKEVSGNITDQFKISYDKQDRVSLFQFIRKDGSNLTEIQYNYDESGRLISRSLKEDNSESICKYEYDEKGNLLSYTYFRGGEGRWIKDRHLEFFFNGNSRAVKSLISGY